MKSSRPLTSTGENQRLPYEEKYVKLNIFDRELNLRIIWPILTKLQLKLSRRSQSVSQKLTAEQGGAAPSCLDHLQQGKIWRIDNQTRLTIKHHHYTATAQNHTLANLCRCFRFQSPLFQFCPFLLLSQEAELHLQQRCKKRQIYLCYFFQLVLIFGSFLGHFGNFGSFLGKICICAI